MGELLIISAVIGILVIMLLYYISQVKKMGVYNGLELTLWFSPFAVYIIFVLSIIIVERLDLRYMTVCGHYHLPFYICFLPLLIQIGLMITQLFIVKLHKLKIIIPTIVHFIYALFMGFFLGSW